MTELAEAVPKDIFRPMFQIVKEEIAATDWKGLQKSRPAHIAGICMFIWDEMVDRKMTTQPFKIGPIVKNSFKGIAKFIESELGKPPVTEAYAASYFNEIDPENSFVDVSLVRCWPNDIHIADVEFSDNRKPVHKGMKVKGSTSRNYHGLHVFGDFIERLNDIAKNKSVERISLIVAHEDLYPVFSRHGFKVSSTTMAQIAFNSAGLGYPMIRKVT